VISLTRRSALALGAATAAALSPHGTRAQAYPERTVRIVVPWAPGGSTDILARVVAEQLRQSLGQPFIVENRPGASGNLGSDAVAKAAPDGYTILFGSMSTHAMNQALFASMPFKGVEDFAPIALLAFVTNTMVTHPAVPAKTVREFIDYGAANPGKIAYASAGAGSTNHLCAALFEKMAGVKMVHVPYRGGAPAVLDTVAGQTQLLFSAGTQTLEHVKAGKLNLLAVTEGKRAHLLPEVPTVAETVPGYEMAVWYGAFGPAGMPKELVARLNGEINRILFLPEVKKKMADIGVEVVNATPDELGATLRADAEKWGKLIKELGIGAS
jgi:tripartite-type tricarboxylate transporter receptor subunit TctC